MEGVGEKCKPLVASIVQGLSPELKQIVDNAQTSVLEQVEELKGQFKQTHEQVVELKGQFKQTLELLEVIQGYSKQTLEQGEVNKRLTTQIAEVTNTLAKDFLDASAHTGIALGLLSANVAVISSPGAREINPLRKEHAGSAGAAVAAAAGKKVAAKKDNKRPEAKHTYCRFKWKTCAEFRSKYTTDAVTQVLMSKPKIQQIPAGTAERYNAESSHIWAQLEPSQKKEIEYEFIAWSQECARAEAATQLAPDDSEATNDGP